MNEFNINEAIELLKQGYIVYSFDKLGKLIVNIQDDLILIKDSNLTCKMDINSFINLYKSNKFYINDTDDNNIDLLKDNEYYNFKHK